MPKLPFRRIPGSFKAVFNGQAANYQYIDVFLVLFIISLLVYLGYLFIYQLS